MADLEEMVLAAVRKHLAARRQDIQDKFPKKLGRAEYHRTCGRHEEIESLGAVLQEAVRKANAQLNDGDDDDPDTT